MNIRPATVADVPALALLQQSVQKMHATAFPERFRSDVPREVMEQAVLASLQAPASCWLVAEGQQPVGYLSADFRERSASWCAAAQSICYLSGLAVDLSYRRRGIARALVVELQHQAAARQVDSIELDVWAFNEQARQFFVGLGFCSVMERMTRVAHNPTSWQSGARI